MQTSNPPEEEKENFRIEERKKAFMRGLDFDHVKRSKEQGRIELRKHVREETFMKRRNI